MTEFNLSGEELIKRLYGKLYQSLENTPGLEDLPGPAAFRLGFETAIQAAEYHQGDDPLEVTLIPVNEEMQKLVDNAGVAEEDLQLLSEDEIKKITDEGSNE